MQRSLRIPNSLTVARLFRRPPSADHGTRSADGGATKPTPMKKVMFAVAMCIGMVSAQAQTDSKMDNKMSHPAHNCMMASDKDWASLNLTPEQTTKVKAIQAECAKECAGKMKEDPKMAMAMDKHEAEVKSVLNADQYDKWMKWCASQPASSSMEKK